MYIYVLLCVLTEDQSVIDVNVALPLASGTR